MCFDALLFLANKLLPVIFIDLKKKKLNFRPVRDLDYHMSQDTM